MARVIWLLLGSAWQVFRPRADLVLENLALRQQLALLHGGRKRLGVNIGALDKAFWVLLSRLWRNWQKPLLLFRPKTVVGWHREGLRLFWRWKSKRGKRKPGRSPIPRAHIELIRTISLQNPHWGLWRIAQEMEFKLGIKHSISTIQKYRVRSGGPASHGLSWKEFLKSHAKEVLACDFMVQYTAMFKAVYVLVILELESRKIVHFNVTSRPTLAWVQQQVREATAPGTAYRYLLHDNDGIFGQLRHKGAAYRSSLDEWLGETMGIEGIHTPYGAPRANAHAERVIQTLQNEALNHFIFLGEGHIYRTCKKFIEFFNRARPHQGIDRIPDPYPELRARPPPGGSLVAKRVLGGLHHDYRMAA